MVLYIRLQQIYRKTYILGTATAKFIIPIMVNQIALNKFNKKIKWIEIS
jgi:hypothetical protein